MLRNQPMRVPSYSFANKSIYALCASYSEYNTTMLYTMAFPTIYDTTQPACDVN